jgi:hypothetical protein
MRTMTRAQIIQLASIILLTVIAVITIVTVGNTIGAF